MAQGRLGRALMWPVLVVDLAVYLIILALASWSLDNYIDGHQTHHCGNAATNYMLMFALLGGTTGIAAVVAGFAHFRAWSVASMAAATSAAVISWALTALAFGLAWKEVRLGGYRGRRLQILEVFIITSTLIHLLYIMLLYAGHFNQRYGLCYGGTGPEGPTRSEGPNREAQKTTNIEPGASAN